MKCGLNENWEVVWRRGPAESRDIVLEARGCSGRRGADPPAGSGLVGRVVMWFWRAPFLSWRVSLPDRLGLSRRTHARATMQLQNDRRPLGEGPLPWCVSSGE